MKSFAGKSAVVTGAGSGIGAGYCLAMAEAGANVVASDLSLENAEATAQLVRDLGPRAIAVQTDVSDLAAMRSLAERAFGEFGTIELVFFNAGIGHYLPLHQTPPDVWQRMIATNIGGSVNGLLAFWDRFRAQPGEKQIVITSSIAGMVQRTNPFRTAYQTCKYALVGLAESISAEGEEYNIAVSVVCPGPVKTSLGTNSRRLLHQESAPQPTPAPERVPPRVVEHQMQPIEVGRFVRRAIERGDFWVMTHPETRYLFEERSAAVLAAFDTAAKDEQEQQASAARA
jgi:NAD(P)-dependent dehydrogenase (short-subunit alcohol dehydrogenase family)